MSESAEETWKYETWIQSAACRQERHAECPLVKIVGDTRYSCNCACGHQEQNDADRPG